jgi:hypothetical protein
MLRIKSRLPRNIGLMWGKGEVTSFSERTMFIIIETVNELSIPNQGETMHSSRPAIITIRSMRLPYLR